jgi:pyrimidine-nucleoside phosphorylase
MLKLDMNPVELIRKKRNGGALTRNELESFVTGYLRGEVREYQMSSFLMAVYFKGMTVEETVTFADVMLHSGEVVDLSAIPGTKVDKHSTGGVGDKVSLILVPIVAACGVPVPMISGRGLGHTGGTLDKLESIPGFRTNLSINEYKSVIADVGAVMIGQTEQIAPADRKMYSLRDVTATVESIPLIAGSIMSKKLAEGIDALVLDVKTGNGAFMQTYEGAVSLAQALVSIGTGCGKQVVGFITDMNQPLGLSVGNWLEVLESVECLRGKNIPDLMEVTYALGGAMLHLGGKAKSIEEGMKLCQSSIWSGKAYEKFLEIVERQGGDATFLKRPEMYPVLSRFAVEVKSASSGYVAAFDTLRIGVISTELGAGRQRVDDMIDPKAGIVFRKKIGDRVEKGETLALIYTDRESALGKAVPDLISSIHIGQEQIARGSVVQSFVDANGVRPWVSPVLN